jgi:hypothetical protein
MALAKRTGPDFLFLSNNHSQKFKDIEAAKEVNVSFQDTKTQDWISVSGTATTSNSDPRIKEIWSRGAAAWFGDLGDGVHDGSATDPRMSLIEVKSKCTLFPFFPFPPGEANADMLQIFHTTLPRSAVSVTSRKSLQPTSPVELQTLETSDR